MPAFRLRHLDVLDLRRLVHPRRPARLLTTDQPSHSGGNDLGPRPRSCSSSHSGPASVQRRVVHGVTTSTSRGSGWTTASRWPSTPARVSRSSSVVALPAGFPPKQLDGLQAVMDRARARLDAPARRGEGSRLMVAVPGGYAAATTPTRRQATAATTSSRVRMPTRPWSPSTTGTRFTLAAYMRSRASSTESGADRDGPPAHDAVHRAARCAEVALVPAAMAPSSPRAPPVPGSDPRMSRGVATPATHHSGQPGA